MPQYLSPGVYVEEVPSAVKAIAGVGTSTPGFIGIVPNSIAVPVESVTDRTIGYRRWDRYHLRPCAPSRAHHGRLVSDQGERQSSRCHACR